MEQHFEDLNFYKGIESIMSYLRWGNALVSTHEPWKYAKSEDESDKAYVKTVLHISLETLRVSGILLQPIIPNISQRLLDRLGIPVDKRGLENAKRPYLNSPTHYPLGPNEGVLMSRLKVPKS